MCSWNTVGTAGCVKTAFKNINPATLRTYIAFINLYAAFMRQLCNHFAVDIRINLAALCSNCFERSQRSG